VPAGAVTSQSGLTSKFIPEPEALALPKERQLFNELLGTLAAAEDRAAMLAALDRAIAQLPEPSKLRGFVQLWRAGVLLERDDFPKAIAAVEESIRLLPDYSAPLITASSLYAYANQPAKAADYFLRAAELDPDSVRKVDDYEVNNIIRRLTVAREERRVNAVSDRLLEIGWIGNTLSGQSSLASSAIERRLRDGDLKAARELVPKLLVPAHSYSLLTVREFSPIWDGIERWAGPRLERQWTIYLHEARQRWTASKAVEAIQDYNDALLAAGHYDTVIREIYPMLIGKIDEKADHDLIFVVTGVARALAQKGRWNDADALFVKTQKVWPLGGQANAINIGANRARYLMFAGRYDDALRQVDAAIAEGRKWQVNPDALAGMYSVRACTLHELKRSADAAVSMSLALAVLFPAEAAGLHLCMENPKAARRALMEGLKDPLGRKSVIGLLQKPDPIPPSEYARKNRSRFDSLRADPELIAEVLKYGRMLPFAANEGAPPEQK
jgi:tetratricopeptide (TPR) repeat protein